MEPLRDDLVTNDPPPLSWFEMPQWMDDAACRQCDPDLHFPEKGGSAVPAKIVCARCPVRAECREYAFVIDVRHGVFGGLSERERRKLRRLAPREAARYLARIEADLVDLAARAMALPDCVDGEVDEFIAPDVAAEVAAAGGRLETNRARELGVCVFGHDMTNPANRYRNGLGRGGELRVACRICTRRRRGEHVEPERGAA